MPSTDPTPDCCRPTVERKGKGALLGIVYGLVPHTFCILFLVFSVVGAATASSLVRRALYLPYLFEISVGLALLFATLSALFYLRRNGLLSAAGIRRRWRYLATMYGATLAVNVLFMLVVFPAAANVRPIGGGGGQVAAQASAIEEIMLRVDIPCPGHAPLITGEVGRMPGVQAVEYSLPDRFLVRYDAARTSLDDILSDALFEAFPAQVLP
jgi:hypothetical protein